MGWWIESHQEVRAHPKTMRLKRFLGVEDIATAIGYLHLLWWWAVDYAPDGQLSRHNPVDIADGVGWPGDPQAFLDAMVNSGWVDKGTLVIHDWDEHEGKLIERRQKDAARKRKPRGD